MVGLGHDRLIGMLRTMLTIRAFEEKVVELHSQGRVPGLLHLYIGEEAVATGVCEALRKEDYITSTHRGHGHCIAKGGDLERMMAELLGKRTGYCHGKGGSMHIAEIDLGILGANGIVAAGIPIAAGAALSAKLRGTGQVVVSFFGDGASNQGAFHEGINLAAAWKLPVVFVCENNLYAISVALRRVSLVTDIAKRAESYGIPGKIVDGNDVLAVYEAASEAVDRARNGGGPTLIECKTYRWRGHFEGEAQRVWGRYRTDEEVEEWKKKCPIARFRQYLVQAGIATEDQCDQVKSEVDRAIEEAVRYAEESPLPRPEDALEGLFAPSHMEVL